MSHILGGEPSEEQLNFVSCFNSGCNIICDAVAGGAKTSTITYISNENPKRKIVMFTYNNSLSSSSQQKFNKFDIKNIEAYTYHTAMSIFYETNQVISDDYLFNDILKRIENSELKLKPNVDFDTIIIDEAQDLRLFYYKFVCCVLRDHTVKNPQIVVLGAQKQVLYDFYGLHCADYRYLMLADQLFSNYTTRTWKNISLSCSFRLTPSNAAFVNYMTNSPGRIVGINTRVESAPVNYWICNLYSHTTIDRLYQQIIKKHQGKTISFLFNSINNNLTKQIINGLSNKYNVMFNINNKKEMTSSKVYVSTYHAFKGMECDTVVVFGIHNQFNQDITIVPNSVNVALTRSNAGNLYIVQHSKNQFCSVYGKGKVHDMTLELKEHIKVFIYDKYWPSRKISNSISYFIADNMIKFMEPDTVKMLLENHVNTVSLQNISTINNVLTKIIDKDDIPLIRLMLLLMFEYDQNMNCFKIDQIINCNTRTQNSIPYNKVNKLRDLYSKTYKTMNDWFQISILVFCDNGFHNTLNDLNVYRIIPCNESELVDILLKLKKTSINKFRCREKTIREEKYVINSKIEMSDALDNPWIVEFMPYDNEPFQILRAALHGCIRKSKKSYVFNLHTCNVTCVESFGSLVDSVYISYLQKPKKLTNEQFIKYTNAFN